MTQKRNEDRLLKMAAKIKETYQPAEIAHQLGRLDGGVVIPGGLLGARGLE